MNSPRAYRLVDSLGLSPTGKWVFFHAHDGKAVIFTADVDLCCRILCRGSGYELPIRRPLSRFLPRATRAKLSFRLRQRLPGAVVLDLRIRIPPRYRMAHRAAHPPVYPPTLSEGKESIR